MAIRDWHSGQLVVLWVGGAFWEGVCYALGIFEENVERLSHLGVVIIGGLQLISIVIPMILLIVTWKWFGNRPHQPDG